MPRSTSLRPGLPLMAAMLVLAAVVFFWKLDQVPLTNWDEGIHSSVTLETFQNHSWLSLSYVILPVRRG